ncbi:MAG: hypothetical protein M3P49_10015 [Actinomycetota bacterium]|nr:hypothetical protein [Actinomycetota bacterium]
MKPTEAIRVGHVSDPETAIFLCKADYARREVWAPLYALLFPDAPPVKIRAPSKKKGQPFRDYPV